MKKNWSTLTRLMAGSAIDILDEWLLIRLTKQQMFCCNMSAKWGGELTSQQRSLNNTLESL
ncbi:uncharacterized protein METZ01_LOCUS165900 [marine metagenome]|uniref:Uncharacterized protein n=1 Tax=marine metagenome TaxID=408172 RepID=A0A382BGU4_9ZZZZ